MRTLLVLVRDPVTSRAFISYAMQFGKDQNINLHFLYVENPMQYPLGTPDMSGVAFSRLQEELEQKVKRGRQAIADQVEEKLPELAGKLIVEVSGEVGNAKNILGDLLDREKAQMVMVESVDEDRFWVKDSWSRDIALEIPFPVWVIPSGSLYAPFREIIYASDYREEDIETLKRLIDLTHMQEPSITALHITDNADFELRIKNAGLQKMLESELEYPRIRVKALVEHDQDDPVSLVNSYASANGVDLIVVLKENRTFLEKIFLSSTTKKIIGEAERPVLVYHA